MEDRNTMIQQLRKFSPGSYQIMVVFGDSEADALGKQIQNVLLQAGWNEISYAHKFFPGTFPTGITIYYGQVYTPSGENLGQVLHDLKTFHVKGHLSDELARELVQINIGPNPMN